MKFQPYFNYPENDKRYVDFTFLNWPCFIFSRTPSDDILVSKSTEECIGPEAGEEEAPAEGEKPSCTGDSLQQSTALASGESQNITRADDTCTWLLSSSLIPIYLRHKLYGSTSHGVGVGSWIYLF